jgi:protein-tyrosine kinase
MSKIAKALEKAKLTVEDGMTPLPSVRNENELRIVPDIPQHLIYTYTKVIRPSHEVFEKNRIVTFSNDAVSINHYNILRTHILKRIVDENRNAIMVTSPIKGEGKTTTAINIALSIAREVHKTALLVDMNLQHPKVHEYLGIGNEEGLTDHLLKGEPLSRLLINPGLDKMVVLPAGEPIKDSAEILGSRRVRDLVRELKSRYRHRFVIFDCPHLLNMPDSMVFSSLVDGIILVVEAGRTTREDIKKALVLLEGQEVLGIVLNKMQEA